ncbi:CvpA family protein [bacterium]|nr:CvpA family protein [bacterium]
MTPIDWILISVIAFNALIGFWRGMIQIVMDLAAFGIGIAAAMIFGKQIGPALAPIIHNTPIALISGYILAWGITYLAIHWLGLFISKLMPMVGLGIANRLGGIVAGGVKGLLFCLPILLPIQLFKPDFFNGSKIACHLAPYVSDIGAVAFPSKSPH